jgi:hypothetical protein
MNTYLTSPPQSYPTDFFMIDDEFDFFDIKNGVDGALRDAITLSCDEQRLDT